MIPLQIWANEHQPVDDLIYRQGYWDQIVFVRDKVASVLTSSYEEYKDLVYVYASHTSKSVELPVFFIHLKDKGVRIWMRNNFHDWNVSVASDHPLTCDFLDTFSDEMGYGYCFCQGMEDKKFSRYNSDKKKFTVCISDNYDLYTFFRVLRKFLNIQVEPSNNGVS